MKKKDSNEKDSMETVINDVIRNSLVCRLAMIDDYKPYIVPLCFGYRERAIYIHSSTKGKKLDLLLKNPNVCFELDINTEIETADRACNWGMKYQSVIGYGKAVFIDNVDEKKAALRIILSHYSDRSFRFSNAALKGTVVIKIEIEHMTGKQSGY